MKIGTRGNKWTERIVRRGFGVDRARCERHTNDVRARMGISNWLVEQALVSELARRSTLAAAFPLPEGRLWAVAAWLHDLRSVAHGHAMFSGCAAYLRDPRFFERPSWPADLIGIMSPVLAGRERVDTVAVLASVVAAATARTGVRRLRLQRRWVGGLLRAAAAVAWGKTEATLLSRIVERGLDECLGAGEPEAEKPRVVPFEGEAAA